MNAWQRFCRWIRPARDKEMDLVNGLILSVSGGLNAEYNVTDHGGWRDPDEVWDNRLARGATCRHAATVLMYSMIRNFVAGEIEYVEGEHTRVPQGTSYHAWIEWQHAGSTWICDAFQWTRAWKRGSYTRGEYVSILHLTPDQVRDRIRAEDMASGHQGQ